MALFTDLLGLVKQATAENEQLWGEVLENSFIDLTEEAIAGRVNIDMSTGNQELSDEVGVASEARNMIIRFTGAPVLAVDAFVPKRQKLYVFDNQCGQPVTVKTTTGIGDTIAVGESVVAVVDADADRVFLMKIHDKNIVAQLASTAIMTAFPCTITIDAGSVVPVIYELVEGDFSTHLSLQTTFTMTIASATSFAWLTGGPEFTDSPKFASFPIIIRQNAVNIRMFVTINANNFQFFVEDPAFLLLPGAVIVVPSFQFTQSIALNP